MASNIQYQLRFLQSPDRARACGFSSKFNRRSLDPCPVLQLIRRNPDSGELITSYEDLGPDIHKFVVHVLLVKERVPVAVEPVEPSPDNQELIEASDEDRDVELDQEDLTSGQALMFGTDIACCSQVKGYRDSVAAMFVFPELFIRTRGFFRLQFNLYAAMGNDVYPRRLAWLVTTPFMSYSYREFPGYRESSQLVNLLYQNGISIMVRTKPTNSRDKAESKSTSSPVKARRKQ